MLKILLVDNQTEQSGSLSSYLKQGGFKVTHLTDLNDGVEVMLAGNEQQTIQNEQYSGFNDVTYEQFQLVVGPLKVIPEARIVTLDNKQLKLTSIEFNLIEILVTNAGQIVSRQELSSSGLGMPLEQYDRSVDVHISSLRQKLGNRPDNRSWIQTVRGQGYQLSPM